MDNKKIVYLGSDNKSYDVKKDISLFLKEKNYNVIDLGVFSEDESSFENIDKAVKEKVNENVGSSGILLFSNQVSDQEGK